MQIKNIFKLLVLEVPIIRKENISLTYAKIKNEIIEYEDFNDFLIKSKSELKQSISKIQTDY